MNNDVFLNIKANFNIYLILLVLLAFSDDVVAQQYDDMHTLKKAVKFRKEQQHQQAIELLEDLKQKHFDHKRINIELAINLIKLEQYDDSIEILKHLQSLTLSAQEKAKLKALFILVNKQLNAHSKRSSLKVEPAYKLLFDATLYYGVDQHSTAFPIYEYLDVFDEGVTLDENVDFDEELIEVRSDDVEKQQDHYFAQQLQAYYLYRFQKHKSSKEKGYQFIFSSLASVYQRQIKNNANMDYRQFKLEPSLSVIINQEWLVNLKMRARLHEQNNRHVLNDNSIQLSASMPLSKGRFKLGYEYREKDSVNTYQLQNASISSPWLEYLWRPTAKIKFKIGSRYRIYNTFDKYNRYRNVMLYSSFNYKFSNSTSLYLSYNNNNLAYVIDDLELVNWADEVKHSFSAGGKFRINQHFSWGINGHIINNKLSQDAGENQWKRLEAYFTYRF